MGKTVQCSIILFKGNIGLDNYLTINSSVTFSSDSIRNARVYIKKSFSNDEYYALGLEFSN